VYNISYYLKTLKFIAPCLAFIVFLFVNYQTSGPIWSNYFITAVAVFIFSNWIGTTFINSEDKTQQYITRLHIKNETSYHIYKIISIMLFILPFYALLIFYPLMIGFFTRSLAVAEILTLFIIHFLFSLMGTSMSMFFNSDLHNHKNNTLPLQALAILVAIMPLSLIFEDNAIVVYATYILPPINFLNERLHNLHNDVFAPDGNLLLFAVYSLGYSLLLIFIYILIVRKKSKQ
jgi:hypothetical protein